MRLTSTDGSICLFVRQISWDDRWETKRIDVICTPWGPKFWTRERVANQETWIFAEMGKEPLTFDLLRVEVEDAEVASERGARVEPFVAKERVYVMRLVENPSNKITPEVLRTLGLGSFVDHPKVAAKRNKRKDFIFE
jgi:hypothetical protein